MKDSNIKKKVNRQRAIELRKQGLSYAVIAERLGVSKSAVGLVVKGVK